MNWVNLLGNTAVLVVLSVLSATHTAKAEDITTQVTSVIDGDTFKTPQGSVRIAGIDAPETGRVCDPQPYSMEATVKLKEILKPGTEVTLHVVGKSYGRLVAVVYLQGQDIAIPLVATGVAWPLTKPYKEAASFVRDNHINIHKAGNISPKKWRSLCPQTRDIGVTKLK
jgi:endonuclease YncB( thermonuclease family)